MRFRVIIEQDEDGNGLKLASEPLLDPLLAQFLPGCEHERGALGAPLLDAGLPPMGAYGVHEQRHAWSASVWRAEPPQGIEDADPLRGEVLACRRWPHDQTHEMVDDGQGGHLLRHS